MCSYSMKPTFSPTLRESNSAPFWNTMPSFSCSAKAGSSARRPCRVWPLIRISPCMFRQTSMLALAGNVAQLSAAVLLLGHVLDGHTVSGSECVDSSAACGVCGMYLDLRCIGLRGANSNLQKASKPRQATVRLLAQIYKALAIHVSPSLMAEPGLTAQRSECQGGAGAS